MDKLIKFFSQNVINYVQLRSSHSFDDEKLRENL